MPKTRVAPRLELDGSPFKLLSALSNGGDSMPLREFQTLLASLHNSKFGMRDTKAKLIADGFVQIRVTLTPVGDEVLKKYQLKARNRSCAKSAPTAVKKATAPTAAPIDSTPLAMAWMGRR